MSIAPRAVGVAGSRRCRPGRAPRPSRLSIDQDRRPTGRAPAAAARSRRELLQRSPAGAPSMVRRMHRRGGIGGDRLLGRMRRQHRERLAPRSAPARPGRPRPRPRVIAPRAAAMSSTRSRAAPARGLGEAVRPAGLRRLRQRHEQRRFGAATAAPAPCRNRRAPPPARPRPGRHRARARDRGRGCRPCRTAAPAATARTICRSLAASERSVRAARPGGRPASTGSSRPRRSGRAPATATRPAAVAAGSMPCGSRSAGPRRR